jgi:hypothetical protein
MRELGAEIASGQRKVRSGASQVEALGGLWLAGISSDVATPLCHGGRGRRKEREGRERKSEGPGSNEFFSKV